VSRVGVAALAVVAITYQLARLQGHPSFGGAGNFFSFFTIQSNILAATMLVLAALVRVGERSRAFDAARTAATFYIAITGVVFAAFLSGLQERLDTHNAFVNSVVHYVLPAAATIDWLVDPPRHRFGAKVALTWLAYPVAWFVYTLVRGAAVGWYPYPFVSVTQHGYGRVAVNGLIFLLAFAAVALALDRIATWRQAYGGAKTDARGEDAGVDARNSESHPNNPQAARAANAEIRAMAENRERGEGEQAVAFFCECGCRDIIPMTASRYEAIGGAWLPGHKPQP
jgi:hypothetical protein